MSAMTFSLREPLRSPVDVSHLTPNGLAGLDAGAIRELPVWRGAERLRVGDVFDISGDDVLDLVFQAELPVLTGVGHGMEHGRITVQGLAGPYAGRRMRGGELHIQGDAGAYAGCGMRGGLLVVQGDAGDFVAAALPGERYGMEGGTVLIHGNAGSRIGDRMRRGSVLIEGNAGDWCGARMRAGTIAVMGATGTGLGAGMRRGTILLWQAPALSPMFRDNGGQTLSFTALLIGAWRKLDGRFGQLPVPGRVQRYLGDRSVGGMGEVLVQLG